jgi:hypothetical protein
MMSDECRKRIHAAVDKALDAIKTVDQPSLEVKVIVKNGGVADSFVQVSTRL